MSDREVSRPLIADLEGIKDIWENTDDSLSVLFFESGMKSKICKNPLLKDHYKAGHGFRVYGRNMIIYIGKIELLEGLVHLYVPSSVIPG